MQSAKALEQLCAALTASARELIEHPDVSALGDRTLRIRECCALVDAQTEPGGECQMPSRTGLDRKACAMIARADGIADLSSQIRLACGGGDKQSLPGLLASYEKRLISLVVSALEMSEIYEERAGLYASRARICEHKAEKKKGQDVLFGRRSVRASLFLGAGIVFTDVLEKNAEEHYDLLADAQELGAIMFRKDLESISFTNPLSRALKRKLNFYLISENEPEKLRHATGIMKTYPYRDVTLYVFSESISSKMLLGAKAQLYPQVVRVHDHQSLIYHNLDTHGVRLFKNARENYYDPNTQCSTITAVVVGLGQYGMEMLKALAWYCQVPGFRIKLYGFDGDADVAQKLNADCPGLTVREFDRSKDHVQATEDASATAYNRYEPRCEIEIHSGIDVKSHAFAQELSEIKNASYVFVCLGTDEINIATSAQIREIYEKMALNSMPEIETVVYDSNLSKKMGYCWDGCNGAQYKSGCLNHKEQAYRIHMIGSTEEFYSVATMIHSDLTKQGLLVHRSHISMHYDEPTLESVRTKGGRVPHGSAKIRLLKKRQGIYDKENEDFWKYEYSYRSSLAQAMFNQLIKRLQKQQLVEVDGWTLDKAERSQAQDLECKRIEHVRWLVYMKTEGYQYSPQRNDLAKHHDLMLSTKDRYPDLKNEK